MYAILMLFHRSQQAVFKLAHIIFAVLKNKLPFNENFSCI